MSAMGTLSLLIVNTAASVAGSTALRFAAKSDNPVLAVVGVTLWVASGVTFVKLAQTQELGVLAMVTSALGLIAANVIGVVLFQELITVRKLVALGLIIAALAILSWPAAAE